MRAGAKPSSIKLQHSSGGVIYRERGGGVEVALISVRGGSVWALPKGLVDKGETSEETALREVSEETGLKGGIIGRIGQISYWYFIKEENARCKKTVDFFLMKYLGGDTAQHDFEVEEARWFLLDEAIERTAYKSEKDMLKKAKAMMEGR